jgi:hypothetical protein
MPDKPGYAGGYSKDQMERVRETCLYVATRLGDYMDDMVVVGGLVPSLLIDDDTMPTGADKHVGTMDLDIGLNLAIFQDNRYQVITDRLRNAGFVQDTNKQGNPTRQRWKIEAPDKVVVDFLIPPTTPEDIGGKIKDIEKDFAALITPGLKLAFIDRRKIFLTGKTLFGSKASREIGVCGPGAFVTLKTLAFRSRGENKDAYDLYYFIRNFGAGVWDIAEALKPLKDEPEVKLALNILEDDFSAHDGLGPVQVSQFLTMDKDDDIQADVVGFVRSLIDLCK